MLHGIGQAGTEGLNKERHRLTRIRTDRQTEGARYQRSGLHSFPCACGNGEVTLPCPLCDIKQKRRDDYSRQDKKGRNVDYPTNDTLSSGVWRGAREGRGEGGEGGVAGAVTVTTHT